MAVIEMLHRLLGASVAYAATATDGIVSLTQPFVGHGSPVDYAGAIAAGLAVLIPIVIVLTHVLQRRRAWFGVVNVLRFAGLLGIPLVMWMTGSFASFEGAKDVSFCESCHTAMDPFVFDMKDPKSTTLAALHYKNRFIQESQCYTCHADYGVFGLVKAKFGGLWHLYYWETDSPMARGEEQITLYGPYPNTWCLHCHAGSQRFLKAGDGIHTSVAHDLLHVDPKTGAPDASCLDCHGPAHISLADWKAEQAKKK